MASGGPSVSSRRTSPRQCRWQTTCPLSALWWASSAAASPCYIGYLMRRSICTATQHNTILQAPPPPPWGCLTSPLEKEWGTLLCCFKSLCDDAELDEEITRGQWIKRFLKGLYNDTELYKETTKGQWIKRFLRKVFIAIPNDMKR